MRSPADDEKAEAEFGPRIAEAAELMRSGMGQFEILSDPKGKLYRAETKLRQERGSNNRFGAGPRRKKGRKPKASPSSYCPRICRVQLTEDLDESRE